MRLLVIVDLKLVSCFGHLVVIVVLVSIKRIGIPVVIARLENTQMLPRTRHALLVQPEGTLVVQGTLHVHYVVRGKRCIIPIQAKHHHPIAIHVL